MKNIAIQFYECTKRYYSDESSVADALDMVYNGSKFFESVKVWFENQK